MDNMTIYYALVTLWALWALVLCGVGAASLFCSERERAQGLRRR